MHGSAPRDNIAHFVAFASHPSTIVALPCFDWFGAIAAGSDREMCPDAAGLPIPLFCRYHEYVSQRIRLDAQTYHRLDAKQDLIKCHLSYPEMKINILEMSGCQKIKKRNHLALTSIFKCHKGLLSS